MSCPCSWSTLMNPLSLLRATWDFAVFCWRSFRVFWIRITSSRRAPTVQNIATFQNQTPGGRVELQRQVSVQAQHGSVSSSMPDSTISDRSPSDVLSIPESSSRVSVHSTGEGVEVSLEQVPSSVKGDKEKNRKTRSVGLFGCTSSAQVSDSSSNSYETF